MRSTRRESVAIGSANERFTLDTNILVYAFDHSAAERQATAETIIRLAPRRDCWLTLQSISEFYAATSRRRLMPQADAAAQAADWLELFPCIAASPNAIRTALPLAAAGRASYWDALLVATAAEAGCNVILTEDMADSAILRGVQIHNPFAAGGNFTELTRQLLDL
jgi:predicted nucleic acid-binding protein